MDIIEISKEKLIELLSNKNKYCGYGAYGILVEYDEETLIKIHYKDIFNTYTNLDIKTLVEEINILLEVEKDMTEFDSKFISKLQQLKKIHKALKKTKSNALIKHIVTCDGYPIGVLLNNYKNYLNLSQVYKNLNNDEKIEVLKRIKELMFDLLENNIFPADIKENNILINPNNLDIKLIDLDGHETRVETKTYIQKYPHIKSYCIKKFEQMSIRLSK
jgi:hypothetical protein